MVKRSEDNSSSTLRCSFCGKSQREVRKLIAGPTVYICDECIELCNEIIADETEREREHYQSRAKIPGSQGNQGFPRLVCHRPGAREENPLGRGP